MPTITSPSVPAPTLVPLFTPRGAPTGPVAAASDREDRRGEAVQAPGESGLRQTFVGTYASQEAEHSEGQVHLAVQGPAVYATFQATRSPVQPYVLEQAAVLFTVPEGYRPATTITWEVNGQLVRSDGKPDPVRPDIQVFRMRVDTEGQVRYVDDLEVDGVGYFHYHTALAWPLAGTDPQVCERTQEIRGLVLSALADLAEEGFSCEQIDWSHLARITVLPTAGPLAIGPQDLRGLTNLTALHLQSWNQATLPWDFLIHTPRLVHLGVTSSHLTAMPPALLEPVPRLQILVLNLPKGFFGQVPFLALPEGWLRSTPHLTLLDLTMARPDLALANLLPDVPNLTHLTFEGPVDRLPDNFLSAVPRLTHLKVREGLDPCFSPAFLAPVRGLTHLELKIFDSHRMVCLADNLSRHPLELEQFSIDFRRATDVNIPVLPSPAQLTHLTLDVTGMTTLPARLLVQAPNLTHLTLWESSWSNTELILSESLLADTPHLVSLSLEIPRLRQLPAQLLASVPKLQHLRLDAPSLEALPSGLLGPVPELASLFLEIRDMKSLPPGFLDSPFHLTALHIRMLELEALPNGVLVETPQLQSFVLETGFRLHALPDHFLAYTPNLARLQLQVGDLQALPASFLALIPQLEYLALENRPPFPVREKALPITLVPEHFLTHAPQLRYLRLFLLGRVTALPDGFLAHVPQLRFLDLDVNGVSSVPEGFLVHAPHLENLSLALKAAEVLPSNFLTHTPYLQDLKLDVDQARALPVDFLADTPRLAQLALRASQVTTLPAGFLAHAPHLETLDLALPNLDSPPVPGDPLWEKLVATSTRVKVIYPDFHISYSPSGGCYLIEFEIELGDILDVVGRHGQTMITAFPWQDFGLFFGFTENHVCPFSIDARFTGPTLEV